MTAETAERAAPTSFTRNPMFILAVCFAAGILIAKYAALNSRMAAGICFAAAAGALVFRSRPVAAAFVAAAFAAGGMLASHAEQASLRADRIKVFYESGAIASGSPFEVEGVLAGMPEASFDGEFLTLRSDQIRYRGVDRPVSGNVRIFVPEGEASDLRSQTADLKYGSRVRVACMLEREDEYLNPGVIRKTEMLDRMDIDATCTVKSPQLIEHIADESVFMPLAWVYERRAKLIDDFHGHLSTPAAGVMIASLLGDKYFLDSDTADLFRDGGTFHILVISGLHITFIGGLLLLLIRRLSGNRWLQFAVTTGVLWAYTLAVGADVPVVRASIMFTALLCSYAIYRQGSLINSLGLCALVLLAWRPSDLFNPSFQLTFVSVAAIVGCAYPLIRKMRSIGTWTPTASHPFPPNVPIWLKQLCETIYWNKDAWKVEIDRQIWSAKLFKMPQFGERGVGVIRSATRYAFDACLVSLIVQLWMLPLVIVYFHRVSFAGVLLNVWVSLFIALESFAAVIGAVMSHVSELAGGPFFMSAEIFNWLMLVVPRLFSDSGWASFRLPAYSHIASIVYILYFLPIVFLAFAVNKWEPFDLQPQRGRPYVSFAAATLTALFSIIVFHPLSAPGPDGRLHIDFLDVGQGDSIFIRFPNGDTLLVDGGGRPDYQEEEGGDANFRPKTMNIGEMVVSPVIWDYGFSSIDHILATHADADHIEGLNDVAKNFSVRSAIFGRMPSEDADFAQTARILERRRIPAEIIYRGERFKFGDAAVEVLFPPETGDVNAASDNDHSIVLRVVYGSRAFLLTGDIEQGAEQALLNGGGTLRADVVKVAHHGSRTSSTQAFVDATQARYAVISVGRRSPFGHPHPEVVERWRSSGAEVMTTGTSGMISFSTDGRDLEVVRYQK